MIMFLIMFIIIKTVALLFPISFKCPVRPDWKCRRCVVMIHVRGALLFHIRSKCAVGPNWKCRGCVVMIVMITAADDDDDDDEHDEEHEDENDDDDEHDDEHDDDVMMKMMRVA